MATERSNRTVVVAPGLVHPGPCPTRELLRLLRSCADRGEGITRMRRPGLLPRYLAASTPGGAPRRVVLYMHRQGLGNAWVTALERYVEQGGSILALHSASASLKGNTRYGNLLGGVFSAHGRVDAFDVQSTPLASGEHRFTVRDERYTHTLTRDVRVLLESNGKPVCWTHTPGRGRVAYLSLGHRSGVFPNPSVAAVMKQLWTWTADQIPPETAGNT